MRHLIIFCEGQTEQGFCTQVLQPHLFPHGEGLIYTFSVGEKNHHHLYGLGTKKYHGAKGVRKFICNTIKGRQGKNTYFTTLFDLYALSADFPGKSVNVRNPANPTPYVLALEYEFGKDIDYYRFIPNLLLHEYETLLFADPDAFQYFFENCADQIERLKEIANSVTNIEEINDSITSAPSKRIIDLIPEYSGRKASDGPDIAGFIGLQTIRSKCPHFDAWLQKLDNLKWDE